MYVGGIGKPKTYRLISLSARSISMDSSLIYFITVVHFRKWNDLVQLYWRRGLLFRGISHEWTGSPVATLLKTHRTRPKIFAVEFLLPYRSATFNRTVRWCRAAFLISLWGTEDTPLKSGYGRIVISHLFLYENRINSIPSHINKVYNSI